MRVILASASPRRRELLRALIDDFEVVPSGVEEPLEGDPMANALALARDKGRDVLSRHPGAVVISADTIVYDLERSYAKPEDAADAVEMWRLLGGRTHRVVTAVGVVAPGFEREAAEVAEVELSALDDTAVADYVVSGRPMDKAGAYAIQDEDVPTVARLEGCYCSVMGLPLWTLKALLEGAGVACRKPDEAYARCGECPGRRDSGEGNR